MSVTNINGTVSVDVVSTVSPARTITRNQARTAMLTSPPLSVPVSASKSVTSITRSSTTATITCTAHGLIVGDYFVVAGADRPPYNGLFKVATKPDANTVTAAILYDPGANAGGTITLQKAFVSLVLGDGTGSTVGTATTDMALDINVRVTSTTAPTTGVNVGVFRSGTGADGSWLTPYQQITSLPAANSENVHTFEVSRGKFLMVACWNVGGTGVYVDISAHEDVSYGVA